MGDYSSLPYMETVDSITTYGGKYKHFLCVTLLDGASTLLFFVAASVVLKKSMVYHKASCL